MSDYLDNKVFDNIFETAVYDCSYIFYSPNKTRHQHGSIINPTHGTPNIQKLGSKYPIHRYTRRIQNMINLKYQP